MKPARRLLERRAEGSLVASPDPEEHAVTGRPAVALTPAAKREALSFLRRRDLLEAILADFDRCGVVGEESSKLLGYLAAVSRKLDRPLAVILQSSSGAGKSALLETILGFVPEEERVAYSALTAQSLYYMSELDLRHKVLAISDEDGARRASYALKLLQSEGRLAIAATGKDPRTGKLATQEYKVEGPVALFLTTTAIEVDEELLNRCFALTVDEDRDQTRAIHARQREEETLEGLLARRERERIVALHRNAQRLLQPVRIVNPYARELTFLDDRTGARWDQLKYLTLIRAIALLRQYQRPRRSVVHDGERIDYIEVTPEDIAVANRLAGEALGRSLDALPPQTRRFLDLLHGWVGSRLAELALERRAFRFSRREAREAMRSSAAQVRRHLGRLVEMEYVLAHRGRRGQGYLYELLWDGEGAAGGSFIMGLADVASLAAGATRLPSSAARLTPLGASSTSPGGEFDPPLTPMRPSFVPRLRARARAHKPLHRKALQPHEAISPPRSQTLEPSDA